MPLRAQQSFECLDGFLDPNPQYACHVHISFELLSFTCSSILQNWYQLPDDLHLIQVDNVAAHTAKNLTIPENVILMFQPPYCPEVNPIERVWRELKRDLAWVHFDDVCQLQHAISQWVCRLSAESLRSLTQSDWIVNALCVAGI